LVAIWASEDATDEERLRHVSYLFESGQEVDTRRCLTKDGQRNRTTISIALGTSKC
jgi:hypothetical protein